MATVLREDGFRVVVYGPPREHPPPHVHVEYGAQGLVVIRLRIGTGSLRISAVYNMKDREVLRAFRLVERHHDRILEAWRAIHGEAYGK